MECCQGAAASVSLLGVLTVVRLSLGANGVLCVWFVYNASRQWLCALIGAVYVVAQIGLAVRPWASLCLGSRQPSGPTYGLQKRRTWKQALLGLTSGQALVRSAQAHLAVGAFCHVPAGIPLSYSSRDAGIGEEGGRFICYFIPGLIASLAALAMIVDTCAIRTKFPAWIALSDLYNMRRFVKVVLPAGYVTSVVLKYVRMASHGTLFTGEPTDVGINVAATVLEVALIAALAGLGFCRTRRGIDSKNSCATDPVHNGPPDSQENKHQIVAADLGGAAKSHQTRAAQLQEEGVGRGRGEGAEPATMAVYRSATTVSAV